MASLIAVKRAWELIGPSQLRNVLGLWFLMFIGTGLEMLGVGLVVPLLAFLTQPDYATRFPAIGSLLARFGREDIVIAAMLILVAIFLVKTVFLAFLIWLQTRFAFRVQVRLSQRLFTLYLMQPYTFHLQRNSAQLLRNLTSEVSLFTSYALVPAFLFLTEGLVVLGVCALLIAIEPLGASVVIGMMGLVAWGFDRLTRHKIVRWGFARQLHEGLRIQHVQQGLGGAKEVKVLGREREFLEQYRLHNERTAHVSHLQLTFSQFPRLGLELLAAIGLATLVLSMIAQGRRLETVLTTLGLFAAAAFRLLPSANRILTAANTMHYSGPIIDTLHLEFQLTIPEPRTSTGAERPFRNSINLENVTFAYSGAPQPALRGLSLTVRHGESVGIMGASGTGKSTLVDVLLGLLIPQTGVVTVDGEDVHANLRNWQRQVGYVPQTIYLTDDSLRRNIAFGVAKEDIDDAAVWRSLRDAQLDVFVGSLPEGLDTIVGERGVRLSGGQRQRIGIARALYHDPAVLVLDEATSSLDAATESGVIDAVKALRGNKTIIVVAHRLGSVEHCDRVVMIANGRVTNEDVNSVGLAHDRALRPASKQ